MNDSRQVPQTVSVVICPLSLADETDARQTADQLSGAGVKVYYIAYADKDIAAALGLASQTAAAYDSAYIALVTNKRPDGILSQVLMSNNDNKVPVYCFLPAENGGRDIYRLEQEAIVLMERSEDALSLAAGKQKTVPASVPVPQDTAPAAVYVRIDDAARKKKRRTAVIVCVTLACLIALLPIVQCARGCYLFGGPLYVDHEPIDTSPYSPPEQEDSGAQDVLGALLDTPSEAMQGYDAAEQAELMEVRMDGDFEYAQFIGGEFKGLGYVNGYNGSEKNVTLPRELAGIEIVGVSGAFFENKTIISVTIPEGYVSIGYNTFYNCTSLRSVTIPDTVTEIEQSAFMGCAALESVNLPDSIGSIGDSAFSKCGSLKVVKLPSELKTIGGYVFRECVSLREIIIPDSVTHIGDAVFEKCESLVKAKLGAQISSVPKQTFNGCLSLRKVTFGGRTETIGSMAFCESGIKDMSVPDGVMEIDKGAFRDCKSLKRISLPISLRKIDGVPFAGCTSLENIEVRGEGHWYKSVDGVLFTADGGTLVNFPSGRGGRYAVPEGTKIIGERAFRDADKLTAVMLPESLEEIGAASFFSSGISEAIIPDSVAKIGEDAFGQCAALRKIHIGAGVADISSGFARQCPELAEITVSPENSAYSFADGKLRSTRDDTLAASIGGVQGQLVIPEGTRRIGKYEYADNTEMTSVVFPESLEAIDERAFMGCTSLAEISFGGSEKEIGAYAFSGCDSLVSVELPDSVVSVGYYAFGDCISLESVRLGANTADISCAFYGCSSLRDIDLPDGIKDIGAAFEYCTSLEYISIPDGIERIDDAFTGCDSLRYAVLGITSHDSEKNYEEFTSLRELYVPKGMKFYTDWVKDCSELERIYYGGTMREWDLSLRMVYAPPSVLDGVEIIYNCETPPEYDPSRFTVSSSDIG